MKPDVRAALIDELAKEQSNDFGLLLSAGMDSASLLFCLLEAGKRVTAYSFTMDHWVSSDFAGARQLARTFNVPFVPIFLPTDIQYTLIEDLRYLRSIGARTKTDYECSWPMIYSYRAIAEPVVAAGMGADGHFCISKKGLLHYKDRINEFRLGLYNSDRYAQKPIHAALAATNGKSIWQPYLTRRMQQEFLGTTWEEVNRPKQKQPILNAYPEYFARMKVTPHTNLQLGDSGIAAHMAKLLQTEYNRNGHKSVVGIYNAINKGEI